MRITNNMIVTQQLSGMQSNLALLQKAQEQVTTGDRFSMASEDPTAATGVIKTDSSLAALEQYKTNVQRASSRVNVEDSVLSQINDLVTRVKQLGIAQNSDTSTDQTRAVANSEVKQIFQQIIDLGNTKFGNEYLFGGDQTDTPPFAAAGSGTSLDYTANNPVGQRQIGIGDGQTIAPTHDGKQIFLDTGVLDAVRDVSRSLAGGTSDARGNALAQLDTAFASMQSVVGDTGAQANRLSTVEQNLDSLKTNLTTFKSNLQEVDMETAMTELTSRQVAYQAALLATSKVSSLDLTDYLR